MIIGARIGHLGSLTGDEGLLQGQFERDIHAALPSFLEPLAEIRAIPSDTVEHVKQKERIFRRRFVPALRRLTAIADLWCAHALGGGSWVTRERYAEAVGSLGAARQFDALLGSDWAQAAKVGLQENGVRCFHWELAFPEVFFERDDSHSGFDVILGNPPYDVLSEQEIGHDISHLRNYISQDAALSPSRVGKNNLYKTFICRAVELLRDGGYLGLIVPMPLLGDEQARGIRQLLLSAGEFREIHAFPQKDNPARRVFRDAKLSTTVFIYQKLSAERRAGSGFRSQVHPAQFIEAGSPALSLNGNSIPLYDPSNVTIVSCSQEDWDLATRIVERPGIGRLGSYCESFQGEVNETTEGRRSGVLHHGPGPGRQLVLRGSNVCLYVLREASQGKAIYIDSHAFLAGKGPDSKAYHSRVPRVGFQRSSPQNNYRRIIAAYVPVGEFCFDTVSYIPQISTTTLSLDFLLGLLNSKIIDWYFRLGSTNSKVNEYQFTNLPCPIFCETAPKEDAALATLSQQALEEDPLSAADVLMPAWASAPFSPVAKDTVEELSRRIRALEEARGQISRRARSTLREEAQPYQRALDLILFRMAGLSDAEIEGVEERLRTML